LDPDNAKPDDSGTVTIIHDLAPESRRKLGALPREITAELDPAGESWLTIVSKANQDGTGQIEVSALADTEDTKDTALEDISILSRWRADGAGRADVVIAEGDGATFRACTTPTRSARRPPKAMPRPALTRPSENRKPALRARECALERATPQRGCGDWPVRYPETES
jgi:hypothetical protein